MDAPAEYLLQSIDTDIIGCHALQTKLHKDRRLSNDDRVKAVSIPHFPSFSPAAPSTVLGKVQSRMLSSKILASAVARLLDDLRTALDPPKKDVESEDSDESEDESIPSNQVHTKTGLVQNSLVSDEEVDEDGGDDGWESGTVQESGSSDDEAALDEDLDGDRGPSPADSRPVQDTSDIESAAPPPPKKVRQEKKSRPAESTFLPSLAVGFVRGNSDSEWSDSEAKVADSERKNRRGQRARRA
jgi:hypothetical protein